MTHGHELKGGTVGGRGCAGRRGVKGGKWDNYNSIINTIYFLKRLKFPLAERKKELRPFATAWMELESIMLSE